MCGDRNNRLTYGYVINRDGIGILLGGNQTLGTTIKRISCGISPSGTFQKGSAPGRPRVRWRGGWRARGLGKHRPDLARSRGAKPGGH